MSHTLFTHPYADGSLIPSCPRASTAPTLICRLNYLIKEWPNFKHRRHPALFIRSATERIIESLLFLIENSSQNSFVMSLNSTSFALEFNFSNDSDSDCDGNDYRLPLNKIWTHQFSTVLHVHVYDS